jgi:hypothetical protein
MVQGRMKLARLLEMPESELEETAKSLESRDLFGRLSSAGVISRAEFSAARFASRRFAGFSLRGSASGLPELVDGDCDLVRLMHRVGRERFEKWFLADKPCSEEESAAACGISSGEARRLRSFLDRAFLQGEFDKGSPAPETYFSAVAGIEIEDGKPALSFFHREIWSRRYKVDHARLAEYLAGMPLGEAQASRRLIDRLELVDKRKTTLYRLLEDALFLQAEFLRSGDPERRRPLTQRCMASRLDSDPSVVNRLISNKSVQMPWGLEAPLEVFFPSSKDVHLARLYALAREFPDLNDEGLARELERRHGVGLSRRSITQYRKELKIGRRRER